MGEVENKSQEDIIHNERLAYLETVCKLIEGGRYKTAQGMPGVSRTTIEHYFQGPSAQKLAGHTEMYSWALDHKLLEEMLIEDGSGNKRSIVAFTEQAKRLLYLAFIARESRKISHFEMGYIRKSTIDFFAELSGLPDRVKRNLGDLYRFAVEEGFLCRPEERVNGDGTETCCPTPRLQEYLKELALLSDGSPNTPSQPAQSQAGEAEKDYMAHVRARMGVSNSVEFLSGVQAQAESDPLVNRIAGRERTSRPKNNAPPAPPTPPPAEVVNLGLQDAIDEQNRLNRLKARLAEEQQARTARGLLGKVKKILGS